MVTVSDNKRCKACNREELEQHDKTRPIQLQSVVAVQLSMTAAMAILENMSSTMTEQLVRGNFTRPTMSPQCYRGEQVVPGYQIRTWPVGMQESRLLAIQLVADPT